MSYASIYKFIRDLLTPLPRGNKFNEAYTSGDIFTDDFTSRLNPTLLRLHVCFDTAGVLSAIRTVGGTPLTETFNSGNNLVANAGYMFDIILEENENLNFQFSVAAQILHFSVIEIPMVS